MAQDSGSNPDLLFANLLWLARDFHSHADGGLSSSCAPRTTDHGTNTPDAAWSGAGFCRFSMFRLIQTRSQTGEDMTWRVRHKYL